MLVLPCGSEISWGIPWTRGEHEDLVDEPMNARSWSYGPSCLYEPPPLLLEPGYREEPYIVVDQRASWWCRVKERTRRAVSHTGESSGQDTATAVWSSSTALRCYSSRISLSLSSSRASYSVYSQLHGVRERHKAVPHVDLGAIRCNACGWLVDRVG